MGASNTSTKVNEFTVSKKGKYIINSFQTLYWKANSCFNCQVLVNSSGVVANTYSNNALFTAGSLNASTIKELNEGDNVSVYIYQYGNGASGENNLNRNKLQLIYIGE